MLEWLSKSFFVEFQIITSEQGVYIKWDDTQANANVK